MQFQHQIIVNLKNEITQSERDTVISAIFKAISDNKHSIDNAEIVKRWEYDD